MLMDREMPKNNNISEKKIKMLCSTGYFSTILKLSLIILQTVPFNEKMNLQLKY